ncbi:MAG TPA: DUF4142 domain-containing protein [Usitatibacter sp.]|jgi:putative membrane protein|nr:DUF4142 domain-containing protein [Usitatibacter sp.]
MHKQDFTRIALAVCCTFALAAHAQGTHRSTTGLSAADAKFVHEAAMGGMEEVELGKLAQQNASNDDVKKFGSRMVDDHSKANDKLKSVAGSKGVALPTSLDSKAQGDVNKLAKSKNFDRDYMDMMVKDHKKDVADFQKQAKSGKDSDVKEFAASTLPTLQEHLKMAQDTDKTVKMAKK